MILPDVNVLLYALRDDAVNHREYRRWLTNVVQGSEAYGICPQVLSAVVRISTHPRIHVRPTELNTALAFCDALLSPPQCEPIVPGARHWSIFADICRSVKATGNLVADAWFAALAIESGCEWITEDRDFARFPGLRWRSPLE